MNEDEHERICSLPDYLPASAVEEELMRSMASEGRAPLDEAASERILDALFELLMRQYHTWQPLPYERRSQLAAFAFRRWHRGTEEATDRLWSVLDMLGFEEASQELSSLDQATIRADMFEDMPFDPYADMR
ncbi:hypothetical protein [Massilia rubra]|uniref:DUF29 domain-containing protein n=1 Tax=Massilia rubra TaxID=2607910 RepID=A0ABX0LQV0_9BURK|nr:hypothetical protein [Massilia rubra]NHZ33844.1 hypothetical protein [Massilia rubra]